MNCAGGFVFCQTNNAGMTFPRNLFLVYFQVKRLLKTICMRFGRWGSTYSSYLFRVSLEALSVIATHAHYHPSPGSLCWLSMQLSLQQLQFPPGHPSVSLIPAPHTYLALWWRTPASPAEHCIIKMGSLEAVQETWVLVSLCGCWLVSVLLTSYPSSLSNFRSAYFRIWHYMQSQQPHINCLNRSHNYLWSDPYNKPLMLI